MSSPEMKEPSSTLTSNQHWSLPDDLLLLCLARVSRLYYPTLSLVSKSFQSLITSPELYKVRSLLDHTETCLYVCIDSIPVQNPRWFTLCRKPYQTLTGRKKKSSGYVLAKSPIPISPPVEDQGHGLVAVGSSIYNIGGSISSSSVHVLNCTSHTWSEAPSLPVKLLSFTASAVGRKIYVAGFNCNGSPSIMVLDTKTQIWEPLPIPLSQRFYSKSACIDGKFHLCTRTSDVAYNSKEGTWDWVGQMRFNDMYSYCAIGNVMYYVSSKAFRWYDDELRGWRYIKGVVGLVKFFSDFPTKSRLNLADYDGKMVVSWDEDLPSRDGHQTMIWCAVIALEWRKNYRYWRQAKYEKWGKVEWFNQVLTVPGKCNVVKVLAATV